MTVGGTIRLDKKRSECRMSEVWYCMYAFDCNLEVVMMGITFVIILPEAEAALFISSIRSQWGDGEFYWQVLLTELGV
jgi:hypothetical protein